MEDGYEEQRSIAIATSQAEEWAERRGKQVKRRQLEKDEFHYMLSPGDPWA